MRYVRIFIPVPCHLLHRFVFGTGGRRWDFQHQAAPKLLWDQTQINQNSNLLAVTVDFTF